MIDKVCIVTGANAGIGLETAAGLAQQGAKVVLACRDQSKGDEARRDIESRGARGTVVALPLDLASLRSVRDFANIFSKNFSRLDVLVNNAGIMPGARLTTADGFEAVFGVNHLGHYVLTRELLDLLKRSAHARIVVVASTMHHRGNLNFDDLMSERLYRPMRAYSDSKLANVMFTYALARRLNGAGITVNCLHPGVVRTNIIRKQIADFPAILRPLGVPAMALMISPERGARTSVFLASSPDAAHVSGSYFVKCAQARSSVSSHDVGAQDRLWDVSARLTGMPA